MKYLLAVGSNVGDRQAMIAEAARRLPSTVRLTDHGPVVETAAVGGPRHSGPYLNSAWVVESALGPHQLLLQLLTIERALGRVRTTECGPRTIDLDLILEHGGWQCHNPLLTLPHPRAHLRPFVLYPALAIAGDWYHPLLRQTLAQCYATCGVSL